MKANVLKAKIVEKGLTIGEFCTMVGFVRSTFDRKLAGVSEFDRNEIEQIMHALDLNAEEIRNIFFTP